VRPRLSVVVPHWPLDHEAEAALERCLASLPECEKIVVVNDGTGFGRNVNIGLRVATGDFVAVVNNDSFVTEGDVYDLCVPGAVTSPLVIGEIPGMAPPIEPGGFHGCFWVAPSPILERIGPYDDRFEGAFWEDDDFLLRLREAGIPTRQIPSVQVRHRGGLTLTKVPDRAGDWYRRNEKRFQAKWNGFLPPPLLMFRRRRGGDSWHFCDNCPEWPRDEFEEQEAIPSSGECPTCRAQWDRGACTYVGGYAAQPLAERAQVVPAAQQRARTHDGKEDDIRAEP
jgi:glycosyltransferase involved in cell wall biosynthesis